MELYDTKSRRQGYVIVDQSTGRVDFYDNSARRLGYGRIAPDGRVERFDINGKRDATGVVLRVPGR